jgi:hypothetical protein
MIQKKKKKFKKKKKKEKENCEFKVVQQFIGSKC